ncbi:MAG TPA: hypothetical protein PKZ34_05045, partial [Thermotogota bacterium]|nr:hypothetical protein [Thermotogota bacterium]
ALHPQEAMILGHGVLSKFPIVEDEVFYIERRPSFQRVVVMYAGKIAEYTDVKTLFKNPKHPYTWGLMNAIARLDIEQKELYNIPGIVSDFLHFPQGCKFHTRCPFAGDRCKTEEPELLEIEPNHFVRCFHIDKLEEAKLKAKAGER